MKLEQLDRIRNAAQEARNGLQAAAKIIKDPNPETFAIVRLDDLTAILDRLDAEELVAATYSEVYDREAKRADENFAAYKAQADKNARLEALARAAIKKALETTGRPFSASDVESAIAEISEGLN